MKITVELDGRKYIFAFKNVHAVDEGYPMGPTTYYTPVILAENGAQLIEMEEVSFYGCGNIFFGVLKAWYKQMFDKLLQYEAEHIYPKYSTEMNIIGEKKRYKGEQKFFNPDGKQYIEGPTGPTGPQCRFGSTTSQE